MIKLFEKLIIQRYDIHKKYGASLKYTLDYQKRLSIIRKIHVKEKEMIENCKVNNRIVSINRHYVRSIVKGKKTKS